MVLVSPDWHGRKPRQHSSKIAVGMKNINGIIIPPKQLESYNGLKVPLATIFIDMV